MSVGEWLLSMIKTLLYSTPNTAKQKRRRERDLGDTQKCVGRVISTIAAKFSKNKQKDHICLI